LGEKKPLHYYVINGHQALLELKYFDPDIIALANIRAKMMHLWVDADACPKVIKEILFRAAERVQLPMTLVANKSLQTPTSRLIKSIRVEGGFDVADNYIVQHLQPGDLVITADIPLAAEAIEKDAHALNPRGTFYSRDNIKERLAMRDLMDELRGSGIQTGGPKALSHADRQAFANQLDRFLAKCH
jgi:uncharacterized protein YaiI (UPF0178 family)